MTTIVPSSKWAERKDRIFFTIEVPDLKTVNVKLTPAGVLTFEAGKYKLHTELLKEIDVEKSKWGIQARGVAFDIRKKADGWWGKLTKEARPRWLSVDWHRWKDEDDDTADATNFDMGNLGGSFDDDAGEASPSGGGGAGADDDEGPPPLESETPLPAATPAAPAATPTAPPPPATAPPATTPAPSPAAAAGAPPPAAQQKQPGPPTTCLFLLPHFFGFSTKTKKKKKKKKKQATNKTHNH
eukprot:TRINITY_DN28689_c0_g1_i1.p1 TRINITY_DN28689_c0_g1~~TRINITY_DN28689_c0_g1_i1.p1  ORF type:complete len:241 (-),score=74.41 TRINITY_DN28689_c0_g1_i1:1-723(-)